MSARPGLCGGHRATGVPTAIANKVARAVQITGWHHTFFRFGLFRLLRRRYLNLNGLNVIRLCDVHGDDSKTSVPIARLNRSRGLRSGGPRTQVIGGECGEPQTGAGVPRIGLLHLLDGALLAD